MHEIEQLWSSPATTCPQCEHAVPMDEIKGGKCLQCWARESAQDLQQSEYREEGLNQCPLPFMSSASEQARKDFETDIELGADDSQYGYQFSTREEATEYATRWKLPVAEYVDTYCELVEKHLPSKRVPCRYDYEKERWIDVR